jgi:DNA-binding NarL/FixJ family response regulator
MTKIVLADDHQVVRRGLKALLSTESDFDIIGEAGDGLETVDLVTRLQPDVLVLDLMMPGINGIEVTRQLDNYSPKISIIILSMHDNRAYVKEALNSGAMAYVLKESPPEEVITAIREVISGRQYLCTLLSHLADLKN